jgi:protein SCO1/2
MNGRRMSERGIRLLLMTAAFLAGLTLFMAVILIVGDRSQTARIPWAAPGGPFALIDQNSKPVTDKDFLGKPLLVFFGYTHCPDVCPTTLFEISEVMRVLGPDASRVNAVFITVDPERDTPAVLKDYLSSFEHQVLGLSGDSAAIAKVAKEYGVYTRKVPREGGDYLMDHSVEVYLMDKDGKFVAPFNLKRQPEVAAADLRKYF